jgi:hypothetical protein
MESAPWHHRCIVDDYVYRSVLFPEFSNSGPHLTGVAQVAYERVSDATLYLNLLHRRLYAGWINIQHTNPRAFGPEPHGDSLANAGPCPGDNCHFSS